MNIKEIIEQLRRRGPGYYANADEQNGFDMALDYLESECSDTDWRSSEEEREAIIKYLQKEADTSYRLNNWSYVCFCRDLIKDIENKEHLK